MPEPGSICCVDIGGTGVKAAAIRADGSTFERLPAIPTPAALPELVEHILGLAASVPGCAGIAVSAPGSVDTEALRIHGSSAVPFIHDSAWPHVVAARSGLDVTIENDANCAGLAEVWYGPGDTPRSICTVVVGTGIGGSIVIDGRVHRGAHFHGGEFGYGVVQRAADGRLQTASHTASTAALVTMVTQAAGGSWTGSSIFDAADAGDPICAAAIEGWYRQLALVIHNVALFLDPEVILLGGGVSQRPAFLDELGHAMDGIYEELDFVQVRPRIRRCHFQADANLFGALAHFLLQGGRAPR